MSYGIRTKPHISGPKKTPPPSGMQRKHDEANLHLSFCNWIDKNYPKDPYVRHEKEKKRGYYTGSLMKVYNNIDGLPDFELILSCGGLNGLYIEFKRPDKPYKVKGNQVAAGFEHQYKFHLHAWANNRAAYFANSLDEACLYYTMYREGKALPKQDMVMRPDKVSIADLKADDFFSKRGL